MKILMTNGDGLAAPEELTIHTVEQLRDDLVAAINDSRDTVTLSMGQVASIDTSAIQVLVAARAFARNAGRDLVLTDIGAESQRSVSQLGLENNLFEPMTEGA